MAKTILVVGDREIEVEQFTKSTVTVDRDDKGAVLLLLLGQRDGDWTHMCAFEPEVAKRLFADLNVNIQNLP